VTQSDLEFLSFIHSQMAIQTSRASWTSVTSAAAELWVRAGQVTAAILVGAVSSDELDVVSCRQSSDLELSTSTIRIEHPFSTLLDGGSIVQLLAERGLLSGVQAEVLLWPDVVACIVLQHDGESLTPELRESLAETSRRMLASATGRPGFLPNPRLLEAIAEYAAGAGHEINNPLASIIGQTQSLLKSSLNTEQRQALETIGAQAWRIRDMIGNSMLFARPPAPNRVTLDLVATARDIIRPMTATAAEDDITIHLASTADQIEMEADRSQVSVLLTHLIRNSLESLRGTRAGGDVSVTLRDDQENVVEISVTDSGPGITSPQAMTHLFDPFYSGRSAGRGLGFGLCLAWRIVRLHGGLLIAENQPESGFAVHMAIPIRATAT